MYHHGIRSIESNTPLASFRTIAASVIGLIATADDADAATFPLNEPVLVTNVDDALGKAGVTGTLATALEQIRSEVRPVMIIVRVAASAVAETQTASVVGSVAGGVKTGMQALLNAQSRFGFKPRILAAPGLETAGVTSALVTLAKKLKAFAYARSTGQTVAEVIADRANYAARELMLLYPDHKALSTLGASAGQTVASLVAAKALGARARIDAEQGPHKTLSNVALNDVLGLTKDIDFDPASMANDAGVLNGADVTTLVRRQGFRFWGSRTCSDVDTFAFENETRMAYILQDSFEDSCMQFIDRPLDTALAKAIISHIDDGLRTLTRQGWLLGGTASFDPARNSIDQLRQGILDIDYDWQVAPPLEHLVITQRKTDRYLINFNALGSANNA
jgi:uncharacterized protein